MLGGGFQLVQFPACLGDSPFELFPSDAGFGPEIVSVDMPVRGAGAAKLG